MSRIKANVRFNERNNTMYYRYFTIEPYAYKVGDTYEREDIKRVDKVVPDKENNVNVGDYDFYRLETTENGEYDLDNDVFCEFFIAVEK